jgi:hypothetical protein
MAEHTQGPWTVDVASRGRCLEIVTENTVPHIRIAGIRSTSDEDWANARLIAAAPKLLAACQELLRCRSDLHWTSIRAAVAEATGQKGA